MSERTIRFQAHIDTAHQYWKAIVMPGDAVIDATCGNGQDTLMLAQLTLTMTEGIVYAMDIQTQAIANTKQLLQKELTSQCFDRVRFILGCHSEFPVEIEPNSIKLIVYNLGYLPRSDKTITTMVQSSLNSIKQAQNLIMPGGAISITCYPGHAEGKREEESLLSYVSTLDPTQWVCSYQRWINRQNAPTLIILRKL
jgi:hypothetical protein